MWLVFNLPNIQDQKTLEDMIIIPFDHRVFTSQSKMVSSNFHPNSSSDFDHEGFGERIEASTNFDEQHTINIG